MNGWESKLPTWSVGDKVATRKSSGACLQALVDDVPGLMAGGADLTGNTGTVIKDHGVQSPEEPAGRQIYFGVREHGMASVMNGMALHGGTLPVGGTFFVFSDYMRGGVRLAAISRGEGHLLVDARLDRARARRPDAPADRAPRVAAGDAGAASDPPGRRQRVRGRVAGGRRVQTVRRR